jgi:hypothetical protein
VITRSGWGARPPKHTPQGVNIARRTATCVHYAGGTPVTLSTFEQACAYVRGDQSYHMDHNGWDDIGYNFLVISAPDYPAIDGLIFEGRGRDIIGAHAYGHNTPWIGVQVAIGGDQAPSPKALASVRYLHDTFVVAAGHGLGQVGHKDGVATACPGLILEAWVKAGMPVDTPEPVTQPASPLPPVFVTPPKHVPKPTPTTAPPGGLNVKIIDLRSGATIYGAGVKPMQRLLGVVPDGAAGPKTKAGLRAAQIRAFGHADYQFGPDTASALLAGK